MSDGLRILLLLACVLGSTTSPSAASDSTAPTLVMPDSARRPRIGLVLSGGGARGAAHVGVLRVLEQEHIPIDYIAGTSMGAIVGGLYAGGMSPDDLDELLHTIDWNDVISDVPERTELPFRRKEEDLLDLVRIEFGISREGIELPSGLVAGQKLDLVLRRLVDQDLSTNQMDSLAIPFRAVATDLARGEMFVVRHGDVADAMRASMAIPGVFTPKTIDGKILVDGGVTRNLPVDVARDMGADIVIAVDLSRQPGPLVGQESIFDIASQTLWVFTTANATLSREELGAGDILVVPDLQGIQTMDFQRVLEAEARGEEAMGPLLDSLRALAVPDAEYDEFLARQRGSGDSFLAGLTVDRIEVVGNERVPTRMVLRPVRTRTSVPLDLLLVRQDLQRIYEIGEFELVDYRVVERDGEWILQFRVKEKFRGPDYIRLGMRVEGNFDGRAGFLLNVLHRHSFVNRLGAEWRNSLTAGDALVLSSEFYQPLDYAGRFFVVPKIYYKKTHGNAFLTPNQQILIDGYRYWGQADLGIVLDNVLEVRGGLRFGHLDAFFGQDSDPTKLRADQASYQAQIVYDNLYASAFPTDGAYYEADLRISRESIGATDRYDRLHVLGIQPWTVDWLTLVGVAEAGTGFGSILPLYDDFQIGGLLHTSGYRWGQIRGADMARAALIALRRIAGMNELVGRGFYGGLSLEAGNALPANHDWKLDNLIISGSALVGIDTVLGPAYLGWGWSEGGHTSMYAILGHVFPAGVLR